MRETGGKNRRMRFYKENCEGSAAGMKGLGNVQRENELRQSSIGGKKKKKKDMSHSAGMHRGKKS